MHEDYRDTELTVTHRQAYARHRGVGISMPGLPAWMPAALGVDGISAVNCRPRDPGVRMTADIRTALRAVGAAPEVALAWAEPMAAAAAKFNITTWRRLAGFAAQCAHESKFKRLEEDLRYRDPARLDKMFSAVRGLDDARQLIARGPEAIANRAYAGRNGNGPEASGDGWRYRGRGLLQITGRANYAAAGAASGRPYVQQPDLLLQPDDAAMASAWFWHWRGCNALADAGDFSAITSRINGDAMEGALERQELYLRALAALA